MPDPTRFRSWAQLSEAFLSRQVNVVHMLFPTTIWMRYGKQFPAKVVAWNHTNGSALTVQEKINKPADLGGQVVAIPFWYSIHNVVLQTLLSANGLALLVLGVMPGGLMGICLAAMKGSL